MNAKWIFSFLLVFLGMWSCTNTSPTEEANEALKTEIETLENEVDSLTDVQDEIEASAAKVDSLLNEIN